MKVINKIYLILFLLVFNVNSFSYTGDLPLTRDSRIKTYLYNESEVYLLVLHSGFQSHILFDKNEKIQTVSLGDSYSWKITPLDNRLFIRPIENDIRTNMVIITNKRTYQFDVISRNYDFDEEKDLVYQIRFTYPKKRKLR